MRARNDERDRDDTAAGRPSRLARGFTLVELLVVIGVMLILVVTTLPAFRALQDSGRVSGAINAVSSTMAAARSLAVREGRDVAVMFRFDPDRQVCSMELLVQEALVYDAGNSLGAATVFVPVAGQSPVELPAGAMVFGYGYGASRVSSPSSEDWYHDLGSLAAFDYGSRRTERDPWLPPRTDVRVFSGTGDPTDVDVQQLDTFIVRFSPDGGAVTNAEELGSMANGGNAFLDLDAALADMADRTGDGAYEDEPLLWDPEAIDNADEPLGVFVKGEFQLRAVPMIAVVDLNRLAGELGIRELWYVRGDAPPERLDANGNGDEDALEITNWIDQFVTPFAFNRYTGEMMRDIDR